MEKNIKLEGMRCSAFYRPINLSIELLSSFIDGKEKGYSLHVENMVIDSARSQCSLISTDKKLRIGVTNDRIDSVVMLGDEEKSLEETNHDCSKYVMDMLKLMGVNATRLAFVPTYSYMGDKSSYACFFKQIFNEKYTSFKDTVLLPSETSQLFRVEENINEKLTKINYLMKLFTMKKVDGGKKDSIEMIEFDINTAVDQKYSFDESDVAAFFKAGPKFCEDYIKHFFKNDDE